MPYPPTSIPPATRDNSTAQQDNHPQDHNGIATALNDIVGQVDTNIAEIASNDSDIASNGGAIANNTALINATEATRNADFQIGTSPRVIGAEISLQGSSVRLRNTGGVAMPGAVESAKSWFGQNATARTVGTSWTSIGVTLTTDASPTGNAIYEIFYTVDFSCSTTGLALAGLRINGASPDVTNDPQVICGIAAGGRVTLSTQVERVNAGALTIELVARRNSGAFTVNQQHTTMLVRGRYDGTA